MGQLIAKRSYKIHPVSTHQGCTLQEVANMLNLTKERVRKIEPKAIVKLRKHMQLNNIRSQDLLD